MILYFSKYRALFLLFFIFLIVALGNLHGSLSDEGLSVKVVVLFSILFIVFIFEILQKKIRFLPYSRSSEILFSIFAISFILVSLIRDGFTDTYLASVILTFVGVIVFIQFLYRLPMKDALQIFLKAMFILLLINLYAHYINTGTFELEITTQRARRLTGILGGGLAGALAGLSAIFSLIVYFLSKSKINAFAILNIFLSWLVMIMADNRTSMMTCSIIYILVFLVLSKQKKVYKFLLLVLLIGVYIFFRFYVQQTLRGQNLSNDTNTRILIWNYGIEQIKDSPLLGYGKQNPFSGNYEALNNEIFGQSLADPHNSYLYIILNNGVIVSSFFFLFIVSFLVSSYKRLKSSNYSILIYIPVYWLIISITGGDYFNFKLNLGAIIFGISLFGFLNHPDLNKRKVHNNNF